MLFRELGASLLGSILPGKGVIRACEQALRTEKYLMSSHPFKYFENSKT